MAFGRRLVFPRLYIYTKKSPLAARFLYICDVASHSGGRFHPFALAYIQKNRSLALVFCIYGSPRRLRRHLWPLVEPIYTKTRRPGLGFLYIWAIAFQTTTESERRKFRRAPGHPWTTCFHENFALWLCFRSWIFRDTQQQPMMGSRRHGIPSSRARRSSRLRSKLGFPFATRELI